MPSSRNTPKASLNNKELNELWIPFKKLTGELNDSATIKKALEFALIYLEIDRLLKIYGINISIFIKRFRGRK